MLLEATLDAYTSRAKELNDDALHPPIFRVCERLIFLYSTTPAENIDSELWASILSSLAAALTAYINTTDGKTRATYYYVEYWDARAEYATDRQRSMTCMLAHWISAHILPVDFDFASNGTPWSIPIVHWAVVYLAFPESDRVKWATDVPEGA